VKSVAEAPRYRFGQLERRGVLIGLRPAQIVVLGIIGLVGLMAVRSLSPGAGMLALVAIVAIGAAASFIPVSGRTIDEWLPVLGTWTLRTVLRRHRFISPQPLAGRTSLQEPDPSLPPTLGGVAILSHPIPGSGSRLGVVKDRRAGTYTGILAVRGRSFALLDGPDKARRLAAGAGILAGLAREAGLIHRVQWVERAVADPGDEVGSYLAENLAVPVNSLIARSYLEVIDEAGPVTQQHDVFVALQIHAGRSAREIKAAGGGDTGACEVLRRELIALSTKLMGAEISVEGALTPRLVAGALRTAFDPQARQSIARLASRSPERAGASVRSAGPMAAEATWSSYRTDGAWHATYWIAEWPRTDADPDFLAPLLLRTEAMRTVSLTMEPISPLKAIRSVEAARTSAAADEELRNRAGFVTTARRQKEHDSLAHHERDLSDGHAFYRFAGFVTVTAPSEDELERACGEIEEAAGRSFLELRRLCGEQDVAFTYTLPLCRGLR
jgi:hypothetical protein